MMSKNKPFPDWQKLEEKFGKNIETSRLIIFKSKYISWALRKLQTDFTEKILNRFFTEQAKTLKKIYQEIFKSKEFKKII